MQAEGYLNRSNVEAAMIFDKSQATTHEVYLLCNKQISHFTACFKPSYMVVKVESLSFMTEKHFYFVDLVHGSLGYSININ